MQRSHASVSLRSSCKCSERLATARWCSERLTAAAMPASPSLGAAPWGSGGTEAATSASARLSILR